LRQSISAQINDAAGFSFESRQTSHGYRIDRHSELQSALELVGKRILAILSVFDL
jgi:hypothetical protein